MRLTRSPDVVEGRLYLYTRDCDLFPGNFRGLCRVGSTGDLVYLGGSYKTEREALLKARRWCRTQYPETTIVY